MSATDRQRRVDAADALCAAAFARAAGTPDRRGVALVAVGGYGRGELAPGSDWDLVLVHDDGVDVAEVAAQVWYPLWDHGVHVDHAVRALSQVAAAAAGDVRVALGLLDARHVAGDTSVTLRLRSALLTRWRRDAREILPRLRETVRSRSDRTGDLAHATVPDLKESAGGLRDTTVLRALVATWLVDVPHADLEQSRRRLLDVRDALHTVTGRAGDRVAPEVWDDLGKALGMGDGLEAQRHVRELGRRIGHLSRLTWRRVDAVLDRPSQPVLARRPRLEPVAASLAVSGSEVVLDHGAEPASDPLLLLRAAAEAAERGLLLSPATAARLAASGPPLPEPWPRRARELFVRLLAAGPGLVPVWETLEETGALERLLPEWERVRLLPHASTVHRYTVDRHLVETCVEAARLVRRVARPDLLVVAALLHDIGKGGLLDHSTAGAPVAADIARRIGFTGHDVDLVRALVRWHLLLPQVATTRDLEDPATVRTVAANVRSHELLDLLAALTEADARATSATAWSTWRSGLVAELVRRVRAVLSGGPGALSDGPRPGDQETPPVRGVPGRIGIRVEPTPAGSRLTVVAEDQVGLLAAVAGALALQRASVREARAWTDDRFAASVWEVEADEPDAAALRQQVQVVLEGRVDPGDRLRRAAGRHPEPSVAVRPEASDDATVLEVRAQDRRGVVHLVCAALVDLDVSVRSAHVATFGPQAVDVFYLQEPGAGALSDERAAAAAHAVRDALGVPATLEV